MSMAISTFQANLMKLTIEQQGDIEIVTAERLVEIKDFPDLSAPPEPLEKTTTADPQRTFIEGILNNEQKAFTCNYNVVDFGTLRSLKGQELDIGMWFGAENHNMKWEPDGSLGRFRGKGYIDVYVNGGGINEIVNMTVSLTMTKGFEPEAI